MMSLSRNTFSYLNEFYDNVDLFTLIKINKKFFAHLKKEDVYKSVCHIMKHDRDVDYLLCNDGAMMSYYIKRLNIDEDSLQANKFSEFVLKLITRDSKDNFKMSNLIGSRGFKFLCLADLNRFSVLELNSNKIGDDGASRFKNFIPYNTKLEKLNLSHSQFTSEGLKEVFFAFENHEKIKVLNVSANNGYSEGMVAVENFLKKNTSIEILNLSNNTIMDTGLKTLAEGLLFNRSLSSLDISGNKISNDGMVALSEIYNKESYSKIRNYTTVFSRRGSFNTGNLNDSVSSVANKIDVNNMRLFHGNSKQLNIHHSLTSPYDGLSQGLGRSSSLIYDIKSYTSNLSASSKGKQTEKAPPTANSASKETENNNTNSNSNINSINNYTNTKVFSNKDNRLVLIDKDDGRRSSNNSNLNTNNLNKSVCVKNRGSIYQYDYDTVHYSNLKTINFSSNKIGDIGINAFFSKLADIGKEPTLSDINLTYNSFTKNSITEIGRYVATTPSLTKLTLNNNDISGAGELIGNCLEANDSLTTLNLNSCNLSEEDMMSIFGQIVKRCNNNSSNSNILIEVNSNSLFGGLEVLDIGGNSMDSEVAEGISKILPQSKLSSLGLSDCSMDDDCFKVISEAVLISKVESFNVSVNDISDESVVDFISHLESILKEKRINSSNIVRFSDNGVNYFNASNNNNYNSFRNQDFNSASSSLPYLRKLDLSINSITDEGAQALFEFLAYSQENTLLTEVKMNGCAITGESSEVIAFSLISNTLLERVELSGNKLDKTSLKNIINACKSSLTLSYINLSKNSDNPRMKNKAVAVSEDVKELIRELNLERKDIKVDI